MDDQIKQNSNFKSKIQNPIYVKKDLKPGEYVTFCTICNSTCYDLCSILGDQDKNKCVVFSNGKCTVYPGHCHWANHQNMLYRINKEIIEEEVINQKQYKLYNDYNGEKKTKTTLLQNLQKKYDQQKQQVQTILNEMTKAINKLSVAAFTTNYISTIDFINLLIENEKKPGWNERINVLSETREIYQIISDIEQNKFQLPF